MPERHRRESAIRTSGEERRNPGSFKRPDRQRLRCLRRSASTASRSTPQRQGPEFKINAMEEKGDEPTNDRFQGEGKGKEKGECNVQKLSKPWDPGMEEGGASSCRTIRRYTRSRNFVRTVRGTSIFQNFLQKIGIHR
ncbi:MAG: hypothetical protein D6795_03115 [Deltaproteobacteria bacterium]|nr:MAG: hypothetical protein D6795_03115 [Deltaproteobacteria bacterium]